MNIAKARGQLQEELVEYSEKDALDDLEGGFPEAKPGKGPKQNAKSQGK